MGLIVKKSIQRAKKRLINYFLTKTNTIPTDIKVKYKSTQIFMKPTPKGSEIKDVNAKIIGRGISAGCGKSCGRGQKGQGARKSSGPRISFEGNGNCPKGLTIIAYSFSEIAKKITEAGGQ
uniref:Uncharacterized protein n=1 Tax=Meloidogyne floridensis TaxID=298350 RepID=A0A915P4N1_9BILA